MVLAHLTAVALTVDPKIDRAPLLPMMDVWTKFKEGRSRRSRAIGRNRKGYRPSKRTNLPTDRPTCAKSNALSSSKGGITTTEICIYKTLFYMFSLQYCFPKENTLKTMHVPTNSEQEITMNNTDLYISGI